VFAPRVSRACLFFLAGVRMLFISLGPAAAQDPIRVQTDEVLVPTVVFDKELYAKLGTQEPHHRDSYTRLVAKNSKLWNDVPVKNLTVKDFHLFEDGLEQKIASVRFEPPAFRVVQDNLGRHPEIVGSGGGLWAYPDLPRTDLSVWLAWPHYVLAYVPSKSPPGSCHHIQVNVPRANLIVWTRSEYCNTPHPASDPLNGTEFGNTLEAAARAGTSTGIDLKLTLATFVDQPDSARVYLSASFPRESLHYEIRDRTLYATIGSLLLVYNEDGALVARYSDFACCDYGNSQESGNSAKESPASSPAEIPALLPNRYEAQVSLAPGKYLIRAVISDGLHFGVQQAPLRIEGAEPGKLAVTGLVLARRVRRLPADRTDERVAGSYTPLVSKGVEFIPTANTEFFREDTLFAYFEINNPAIAGQPPARIFANLRILDSSSGSPADTFAPVDTATYATPGNPVIAVGRGLALSHLAPGAYRLQVQATDATGRNTEWRSMDFTVTAAAPLQLDADTQRGKKEAILPPDPH